MADFDDADLAALGRLGVTRHQDGSLRSASGGVVSDGLAAAMLRDGSGGSHPLNPGNYQRPYLTPGHAVDSPANRRNGARAVVPKPPEGGGRSVGLCTTPDRGQVPEPMAKVTLPPMNAAPAVPGLSGLVSAQDYHRGHLRGGHQAVPPGDRGPVNPVPAVTGSGPARYEAARSAYEAGLAADRMGRHSPSQECTAKPAVGTWCPSPDLRASSVPMGVNPSPLTGMAPGER